MGKRVLLLPLLLLLVPIWSTASTVTLPKTGQTLCYDANGTIDCVNTGQDGETQIGAPWPVPRFTDNSNGTVTDNLTGLIWLQDVLCAALNPPPADPAVNQHGGMDWASAVVAARTLTSGQCGLTDGSVAGDWRLPNVNELESLMDISQFNPPLPQDNPFINLHQPGFPSYWTSTITGDYFPGTDAIGADFYTGTIQGDAKKNPKFVWPVKGDSTTLPRTGQNTCWDPSGNVVPCNGSGTDGDLQKGVPLPNPRFIDNGNGTTTDSLTGLIWPKNAGCFSNISSQRQAITLAQTLADGACDLADGSVAGDWRVPNRKELRSLVDYGGWWLQAPEFYDKPAHGWYWTSDSFPIVPDTSRKWMIKSQGLDWLSDTLLTYQQLPPYYMLPVRGGASDAVVITPASLIQTYDGTPKSVTATTYPAGLAVSISYAGSATPPTNAGTYLVVATIVDPSHQGSASRTLTIKKKTPTVTWDAPAAIVSGTALSATQLNATGSVPGSFVYNPGNGAVLPPGTQTLTAVFTPNDTTNYATASGNVALTVIPTFTVTFDPGNGSLTGTASQTVASGASTSAVTAVPAAGFNFV